MKKITISKNDANQRIDNFFRKSFPKISTPLVYKFLRTKKIKVNEKKVDPNYKLVLGDVLTMYLADSFFEKNNEKDFLTTNKKINVVFEDKNILVVNKPFGLVVHEDNENTVDTLINRVKYYLFNKQEWNPEVENSFSPSLVNRIDRNTCGLVIVAKNAAALQILNEKIKNREIKKFYLCLVSGSITPKNGTLSHFLTKNEDSKIVTVTGKPINNFSKDIITKYRTIKYANNVSLLEVELVTGRTHQIRAHFNYINHPLIGEKKYTNKDANTNPNFKYQALCSYKIVFSFEINSGELDYLSGKEIKINPPEEFNL